MTRELITRASYLNTNFNQVISLSRATVGSADVRNAFLALMEVKSYKNQQGEESERERKTSEVILNQVYEPGPFTDSPLFDRRSPVAIAVNFVKIH